MSSAAERLGELGRALGGMRWVQGPGGNVSIKEGGKEGGDLLVKASGVRLADVGSAFARVPLADARLATAGDPAADARTFAVTPRPSLETYFHAIGDVVVAHTHATGVLLSACATAPLSDLGVPRVPYARPGRGIALAVEPLLEGRADADGTRAVVLESHGLIVYAPSVEAAVARTIAIDDAARAPFGAPPDLDAALADVCRAPEIAIEGGVARALPDRAPPPASGPRYLFPDAVVYASVVSVDLATPDAAARAVAALPRPAVLVDGRGRRLVAAKKSLQLAYAVEVALAHDWVEDALAARGLARYLPDDEPAKILDLPSEQYRIRL